MVKAYMKESNVKRFCLYLFTATYLPEEKFANGSSSEVSVTGSLRRHLAPFIDH